MSDYYVSENDPQTAKEIAERYGFCLARGVFTPEEMARLENDMATAHEAFGGRPPDAYSCPSLRWVVLDERVRALAHALIGDTLVYYRETNIAYEKEPGRLTDNPYSEFHCDARGTRTHLSNWNDKWGGLYPAYRFAIYFRNYRDYSGGLKVAPGSHLEGFRYFRQFAFPGAISRLPVAAHNIANMSIKFPAAPLDLYNVPSVPGDIVIFSLRTFHAAGAVRFDGRPTLALLPLIEKDVRTAVPQVCRPRAPGPRNALFFDYGAPVEASDFYIKWRALDSVVSAPENFDYRTPPPPDVFIRNDRIIAALAEQLVSKLDIYLRSGGVLEMGAVPDDLRRSAKELVSLCLAHKEFSPYHPLFDMDAFKKSVQINPLEAAVAVAREVVAKRAALKADDERIKQEEAKLPA